MTTVYVWRPKPDLNVMMFPNTDFADKLALMADPRFGNMVPVTETGSESQAEDETAARTDLDRIRGSWTSRQLAS